MKKLTLFLLATLFSALSFAALNPYAYGLKSDLSLDESTLTVNYSLNADATEVNILILNGESVVKTIPCEGIAKGSYTKVIPTADLSKSTSLTWKVEVKGTSVGSPTKQTEEFKFFLPHSMDVDTDIESDYFGRWYVIEATNGGQSKSGYQSNPLGRGLYAFDAALNPILNSAGTRGFTGGMTLGAVAPTNNDGEYFNIYRVATSGGRVFVGRFRESYAPVLEATDLHSTDYPIVLNSTHGRTVGLDVRGRGENLKLVLLDTDFNLKEYNLGTAGSASTPTKTTDLSGTIVRDNATIAYDNEGEIWINQNDPTLTHPTIAHIDAEGVDYDNLTANLSHTMGVKISGISVSPDGSELAVAAPSKIMVYTISKDSEGKISLTTKYTLPTSRDNTAVSYDYAGNLYAANRYSERINFYAMPYDGEVTTPAPSKYAFELTEVVPEVYTITVEKVGEGTIEGGGEYLENSTVTLKATPEEHYEFTGWTGDVTSTDNPLTIIVDGNKNIIANFVKKKYTLTVFVNDENKGTIDVATGSHEYGTEVTLTATPKPSYKLLAWSNKATTPSITLTMDNNKAVSAYFVKEYANEPTFTIEKVWENTINIPGTGNGYQAVGWDGKIYMQDAGNKKIKVFSNGTEEATEYAAGGAGQQIAVDEAGNLIVFNATFYVANPNAILIYKKGTTTGKEVSFTLPQPGRCDFFTASGDIYSAEGGYIYFYCNTTTVVNRLKITNGAATAADVTTDVICANLPSAGTQSNVVVDIFGNIHVESKQKSPGVYNITNLTTTADTHLGGAGKKTLNSTIGGCTFELGGKEWWAYLAGTTDYSSEWQLYNETDKTILSNELYLTTTNTTAGATANWLNAQVVNEKTAYIYQFCPKVGAAVWEVTMKETFTVAASANTAEWGTVAGAGQYLEGTTATLTATPNIGYKFVNWTKGGEVVYTDATYSFPVTENVELVANFEAITSKDPRAWAYDMKLGEEGDNYTFTFKATTAGQATINFNDKDGNALAQPASQIMTAVAGENKFAIAKNAFAAGVDAFWSITMDGAPIEGVVEVTDQSRGIYDFYNMMGVVVDNNTDSKDFGKIYIQQSYQRSYATSEAKNDGITTRANNQTSGIFIYNQELDELNFPSNVGIKPTVPAGYTEIGSSSSAFQRLNIHPKTGNLVFSHAVSGKPAVFAIDRDNMTGAVTNLLTGVADMTRSVAHCFDAEGTLYVMDFAGSKGAIYKVVNGEATKFTETSGRFINANITITSDGRGGFWVSQNRGQIDYYYQLVHVTSEGLIDWSVYDDHVTYVAATKDDPGKLGTSSLGWLGSSSRGALAYDVERQILAQGRNGKVELYSVSYEPTIELTPLHTIASNDLGTNIDGLAFDYAGDLYVVNSSKEKFQKFTLPTADNICTVAAPALEAIRFTPVYTVSVASNNNEWGIANGGGTFEEGQNATITAVAATNYEFVNWTKEGAEVSTENPYTFAVTESATYIANFKEITKYTINATANDGEMGSVTGGGDYYEGSTATLTAKANGGYVFVDWSDGNTEETRTIEVTSDLNLTANFKVAIPRAWAYDLRKDEVGDNYTFTFKTTSAGTATLIFKDKDGNTLDFGAYTAIATEAGEQTITIAKTVFEAATKDIYWSVELAGEPIAKMAEITNPARNIYDFYNMMGVVVDNDPNSDEFGKIYIQQSYNGASDGIADRSDTQTAGIFIYNQALEELNAPANTGIKPQLPYTIGANRQFFKRITINPLNGNIAFCNNTTTNGGAYAVSRENLAGEAINLTKHISEIQKVNALCFDDEGNLYVVANVSTSGSPNGNIYQIKTDGTHTELTLNGVNLFYDQEIAMASDGRGGLWIAQNRWGTAAGTLFHVNVAENKIDFKVEADKDYSDWFEGANYRGAIAYDKQRDILAVHSQACASVFQVTYAADGVPSISKICQTPNLGKNELDGLAFDYAGDLYVVNSGTERFYKYVIPTNNNTCTVPAPASQVIKKEARYTVTVKAEPADMGTVSEGGEYKAGETITITATPNKGYQFVNWTYGSETSTNNPLELVVNSDITVTAHFQVEPLAIKGIVKRAVQIGESTVVLTHENDGTPHLYKVVNGELEAEISQVGVEPAAAGYLSISDIAATEDGKLVACNYVRTVYGTTNGISYFYIWDNLTKEPKKWFQSCASSNSAESDQGYTMGVKGTSTNAIVMTTGVHSTKRGVRMSQYSIIEGKYIDVNNSGGETTNDYYFYFGDTQGTIFNETNSGTKLEMSSLSENWVMDGNMIEPILWSVPATRTENHNILSTLPDNTLGKKFNGATYFSMYGNHFMVAPYADTDGNLAGVRVLNITQGLDQATEATDESLDLTTPISATAAATAVKVNGEELTITLVADNQLYTLATTLDLTTYTRTLTNGNFGTICLPYGSSYYTGAKFYEISWMKMRGTTPEGIYLDEVIEPLIAGKPYIFKATSNILTVYANTDAVNEPIPGEAGLTGTFEPISTDNTILEGNYMIAQNKFWLCGAGCSLSENRAYINAEIISQHTTEKQEIPGRRRISMGAAGENGTTGVDNLTEDATIQPNAHGTYDVLGRQLKEPTVAGFYIINGQKVIITK